ncbi:MAG: hypothetical protein JTT11_09540 [Candidatus Brockarchaeota archaeon]|nr:hypothetical protein [Candidatus Brockarchaeota archaeon]
MNDRENYLAAVEFGGPEWIPCSVSFLPGAWKRHREALEELVLEHPLIFRGFKKGSVDFDDMGHWKRGEYFTDAWGVVWRHAIDGIFGQIAAHPLDDWSKLATYQPPDTARFTEDGPREDWASVRRKVEAARERGELTWGEGGNRFFERLHFLRGFRNLMADFARGPPELQKLIDLVVSANMRVIAKWLEIGVDVMSFQDDLGTQVSCMVSPVTFRRYLKPGYERMFKPCREAGSHVAFHSDGHILEIVGDLIDAGVTVINPQVRANTLEGIAKTMKGKVCINLDLDRQLFPFATPSEIMEHVKNAVLELGSKDGGLMLSAECGPDVPLENVEAICKAFEEFCIGRR